MILPKYWSPTKKLMVLGAMAGGKLVEDTVTGNPLKFFTDKAKPLKSLLIPFTPQQEGTGDPSPENVRPIIPWEGLKVFGGGKNLLNVSEEGYIAYSWNRFLPNPFKKAGTYKVSCQKQFGGSSEYGCRLCISNVTNTAEIVGNALTAWGFGKGTFLTATVNVTEEQAKGKYLKFEMHSAGATLEGVINAELQVEVGNTATAYEPYKPITETDIVFPSPVYGGEHEAVSGKLMNGYGSYTFTGAEADNFEFVYTREIGGVERHYFNTKAIDRIVKSNCTNECYSNIALSSLTTNSEPCRFYVGTPTRQVILQIDASLCDPTVESFSAWLHDNNWQLVYPLAEPQEIQLTPQQINAIKGNNTIWSDADGSMTAVYLKKG